ncbi:FAD-dependent oxidoreductase [Nitratireductor thuwali]|uniref:Hydrogen cyanide synthase subunit HcnB n=1 Tax=Nitratireductor thuwali TaxID=2267699 RepID=A0ABY5MS36_9HYPH|nr:Hydrogen cyanide synthase subunit HcnB [Nitratireductor thuwali]
MSGVYDVAVVGAGPAGMTVATHAAAQGLSVIVLDEQGGPGGQIYNSVEQSPLRGHPALGKDYARGLDLARELRGCGAEYVCGANVWQAEAGGALWQVVFSRQARARRIEARQLVLATGAYERPFPIPGWELPGVMSAGGAQILLKSVGLAKPNAIFAGSGPLLYLVALQYLRAGIPVRAILDTTHNANYRRSLKMIPGALGRFSTLFKGMRMLLALRSSRTAFIGGVSALAAEGERRCRSVSCRANGKVYRFESAEMLFLHHGVVPNVQLALATGCEQHWDAQQHTWCITCDPWGRTSRPGLYVTGDAAGILGADAARLRAQLTVLAVSAKIGRIEKEQFHSESRRLQAQLRKEEALRRFLDALYEPPEQFRIPSDATFACRCEEVTAGAIRECVRAGDGDPNRIKSLLRCGMGPCQGRMCSITVSQIVAREKRLFPGDIGQFRSRPPARPVHLDELASLAMEEDTGVPA